MTRPRSTSEAVESSKWRGTHHAVRGVDVDLAGWKSRDCLSFSPGSCLKLFRAVGDIPFLLSLSAHIRS